jgi:hypothetical protein
VKSIDIALAIAWSALGEHTTRDKEQSQGNRLIFQNDPGRGLTFMFLSGLKVRKEWWCSMNEILTLHQFHHETRTSQLPVAWRIVVGHAENSALSPFQEHNYDY